jgi:hypothetical protein
MTPLPSSIKGGNQPDVRILGRGEDATGPAGHAAQQTVRWRSMQVRSTSSGSRVHQSSCEKISTSWKPS